MTRQTVRRNICVETLETRQLLSVGTTDLQQYALEELNRARMSPGTAAVEATTNLSRATQDTYRFYGVNLDQTRRELSGEAAEAPLAWNDSLARAATGHSDDMAANKFQSHEGSDGSKLEDRLDEAGYTDRETLGENAFAYADSVDNAMQAFLVDYGVGDKGHRGQIFRDTFEEVGIGIAQTNGVGVGPTVLTQNFGARKGESPYLLGVIYDDRDGDDQYSVGEGRDDVTVVVSKVDNQGKLADPQEVRPWGSGGYQVQLDPGSYEVLARQGDKVIRRQRATLVDENIKVDFVASDPWDNSTYKPPGAAESTPAPIAKPPISAPAPAPAPAAAKASAPAPVAAVSQPQAPVAATLNRAASVTPVGPPVVSTPTPTQTQPTTTPAASKPTFVPIQQVYTGRRPTAPRTAVAATSGFSWSHMNWRSWNGSTR